MYYVYDNPTYEVANKLICIFNDDGRRAEYRRGRYWCNGDDDDVEIGYLERSIFGVLMCPLFPSNIDVCRLWNKQYD